MEPLEPFMNLNYEDYESLISSLIQIYTGTNELSGTFREQTTCTNLFWKCFIDDESFHWICRRTFGRSLISVSPEGVGKLSVESNAFCGCVRLFSIVMEVTIVSVVFLFIYVSHSQNKLSQTKLF